jgi:hypothetical protein
VHSGALPTRARFLAILSNESHVAGFLTLDKTATPLHDTLHASPPF